MGGPKGPLPWDPWAPMGPLGFPGSPPVGSLWAPKGPLPWDPIPRTGPDLVPALAREPGFSDFRFSRFCFVQNHFGKSGGEISRKNE